MKLKNRRYGYKRKWHGRMEVTEGRRGMEGSKTGNYK